MYILKFYNLEMIDNDRVAPVLNLNASIGISV